MKFWKDTCITIKMPTHLYNAISSLKYNRYNTCITYIYIVYAVLNYQSRWIKSSNKNNISRKISISIYYIIMYGIVVYLNACIKK